MQKIDCALQKVTALLLPAMPRTVKDVFLDFVPLAERFIWQLMLILCRSCWALGTARVCFKLGLTWSIIEGVFFVRSRLERGDLFQELREDSVLHHYQSGSKSCAYWLMMKSVVLWAAGLSLHLGFDSESSLIIAISCSELTSVLLTRADLDIFI